MAVVWGGEERVNGLIPGLLLQLMSRSVFEQEIGPQFTPGAAPSVLLLLRGRWDSTCGVNAYNCTFICSLKLV